MNIARKLILLALLVFLPGGCVSEVSEIIGEAEPARLSRQEPLENTEILKARVNLGLGNLKVSRAEAPSLFKLEINYDGKNDQPRVDFSRSGNEADLSVELEGKKGSGWLGDDNSVDLSLSPEAALEAVFVTGVGENIVDLSGMKIKRMEVVNGVGSSEIFMEEGNKTTCSSLDVTNGIGSLEMTGLGNYSFDYFRFKGGIGDSSLDFSGEWKEIGDIEIKVGMGSLRIVVPDNLGVRVRSRKSFFSNVSLPGFEQVGNEYLSSNIENAGKEIVIQLHAGIGDVKVDRE